MEDYRKIIGAAVILLMIASAVIVLGIPMFEANATCYTEKAVCHGLPMGEKCIGEKSLETEFDEKAECNSIENISNRCQQLGEKLCEVNQEGIGTQWADKASVHGKSCTEWSEAYDIDLKSC